MTRLPRSNNPTEIEAFDTVCQRLGGFDGNISAEWVDGYLTALAAGPQPLPISEVIAAMAGDAYERAFADPDDQAMAQRALRTRAVVLADQLDPESLYDAPDALRLTPLMLAWDDTARAEAVAEGSIDAEHAGELVTGAEWADGFFAALEQFGAGWPSSADEEQAALFASLLQQVHALQLAEGSDALRAHIATTYPGADSEGADRDRLVDAACYAVQDLRLYWVDNTPKPETRRVEKTPGRNDPCPCGSGKKYKKCHGVTVA